MPCLAQRATSSSSPKGEPSHATPEIDFQTCLDDLISEASCLHNIAFKLPKPNAVAGKILEHAVSTMDDLFSRWEPIIWKVGWTHNPAFRWSNSLYGYQHSLDRWTDMIVLCVSPEPYTPAMLEATLIEKYKDST